MIRYLKVVMEAPSENFSGQYCTITGIRVYGESMHQVMRKTLKGLDTPTVEKSI